MSKTTNEKGSELQMIGLLMGVGNEAIPLQEKRGQKSFCESIDLPTDCRGKEKELEAMGFKLGEPYKDDPIFRPVELPEGWKKQATEHNMWSDLLDKKGRRRAAIFYKAAFYDRRADMNIIRRFTYRQNYDDGDCYDETGLTHIQHQVLDCETPVFKCEKILVKKGNDGKEDWDYSREVSEKQKAECTSWLDSHYPEWQDETKYWD